MAFLDKLKFWKHEEQPQLELGNYPALDSRPESPRFDGGMAPPSQGLTEMPGETSEPSSMPRLEEIGMAPPPPGRTDFGGRTASIGAPSAFSPPQDMNRDMQIVQAKLDTLKALLDSVTAKLERIDRKLPEREEEVAPVARRWR
jgi:hypothetical protein